MTLNFFSTRGPSDDWDPQGYSDEDKVAEDLAELGMHTLEDKKKEEEEEEEVIAVVEAPDDVVAAIEEEEDVDEDVDELTELDRVAKSLRPDDIVIPFNDEE